MYAAISIYQFSKDSVHVDLGVQLVVTYYVLVFFVLFVVVFCGQNKISFHLNLKKNLSDWKLCRGKLAVMKNT